MKLGTQAGRERKNQETKPYTTRALRPMLRCLLAAGILAALSPFVAQVPVIQRGLLDLVLVVGKFVPSIAATSRATTEPIGNEITMAIQWPFYPVYVLLWFYCFPPWSHRLKRAILQRSLTLNPARRYFIVPLGILVLGLWLAGDCGLLEFPTLYNGRFLPPYETAPQLSSISKSRIAMTIYAWFAPFAEATLLWMFFSFTINARIYLFPSTWAKRDAANE